MANNSILFLTLRVFSATGGIEKVSKVVCMALSEIAKEPHIENLTIFSMYDRQKDVDEKYVPLSIFFGFAKRKFNFVWQAIRLGFKSEIIVLSHINLLSIGYILKLLSPQKKLVLFAHGIEVWAPLSASRKKMLLKCDQVLTVSQFTKDKMLEEYQVAENKITVLNNCLDPYLPEYKSNGKDAELLEKYDFKNDSIVLMTLTRLSSKELYKGYDNVLMSVSQLKEKYPGIKYLVVGKYDDAEKKRLDAIIEKHSLQEYVVFSGYIADEELAKHYSLADIYVMPSKKEGFGIVFIEAMHYGLPVIAGNKDGSADALCNGKLGILIDPDNQEQINTAIEKIILDKKKFLPDAILLEQHFSYNAYKAKLKNIINHLTMPAVLLHALFVSISF